MNTCKGTAYMKISAFYENILDAINYEHLDTKMYLEQLKQNGMKKYIFPMKH